MFCTGNIVSLAQAAVHLTSGWKAARSVSHTPAPGPCNPHFAPLPWCSSITNTASVGTVAVRHAWCRTPCGHGVGHSPVVVWPNRTCCKILVHGTLTVASHVPDSAAVHMHVGCSCQGNQLKQPTAMCYTAACTRGRDVTCQTVHKSPLKSLEPSEARDAFF